jgi:acetyltransferase-like isoleucine patch superfamily enzyme
MTKGKLAEMPMVVGDGIRFAADLALHGLASLPAALVFFWLWGLGAWWARLIAFAAAYAALAAAFPLAVLLFAVILVRKVSPGTYPLRSREAARWIAAESLVILVHRSFLRGYLEDFGLPRRLYHRCLGAKIGRNFFVGGEARILDPWALEVGDNALVGAFSVIAGHVIEGDNITVKPVRIGAGATIGMRSVVLPGVRVGVGSIVGAGALVAKDTIIPDGEVWAGVPARKIGEVAMGQPESGGARL